MKLNAPIILVLVVGGVLSVLAFATTRGWEDDRAMRDFEREALGHAASLRREVSSTIEVIHAIKAFYGASVKVERAEFRAFVAVEIAEEHHGIQALEWIPRVAAADRAGFEAAARDDGLAGFSFTERDSQGRMIAAAARAEYFPVYFIEPFAGNEAAVGFDLGSNPVRLAALEKARDSGEIVATARITLVQETGEQYGFLVFVPVYRSGAPVGTIEERRANLQGFGLGVLRIGDIVAEALGHGGHGTDAMDMFIFDTTAPTGQQLLYPKSATVEDPADIGVAVCVNTPFGVGGRDWLLVHCPAGAMTATEYWQSWAVLIVGLALTGTLTLYLLFMLRQRARTETISSELTQLIDTANAPIFGIDIHGLVNEWNQKAATITGYSKDEVMGRDLVADFISDDYKTPVKAVLDAALKGQETANFEFPLYSKTGDRLDILLNSTTRRDVEGAIVGVVGIGQDITELRETRAQVIQSSKMATLGEMATGVAHELNQPLNIIRMAAESAQERIEDGEIDGEWLRGKLQRISRQTERAAAIIDHMRIFGRISDETPVEFHARDAVEGALGLIGAQLRLLDIEIETVFPERLIKVLGHVMQLEQVILNLVSNARDAIAGKDLVNGGRHKISLIIEDSDETLRLIVRDTGGGIPEKALSRIFEPFYTTKEIGKGTGLGLSVSYGIIADMGGTLEATNTQDGAQFTITLPVAKQRPVTAGAIAG